MTELFTVANVVMTAASIVILSLSRRRAGSHSAPCDPLRAFLDIVEILRRQGRITARDARRMRRAVRGIAR